MSDDDFSGFTFLKKRKSRKMLEGHIAANTSSDAEALANSFMRRKSQTMNSQFNTLKRSSEGNKELFATLIPGNIDLIFMTRYLAMDLLTQPEIFESKVVGCFVKLMTEFHLDAGEYLMFGRVTGNFQLFALPTCILF
jgi:hypothetical protein